jgi:Mg-chelatase subunit ChlD
VGGTTNTKRALETAVGLMAGANQTIPTVVLVVTDGRSSVDPSEPAARLSGLPNTAVYAVATGDPQLANGYCNFINLYFDERIIKLKKYFFILFNLIF